MSEDRSFASNVPDDDAWPVNFEAHQRAQRRRMAALPLEAKLDWLEEAHRIVLALQAERAKLKDGTPDHDNPHRSA